MYSSPCFQVYTKIIMTAMNFRGRGYDTSSVDFPSCHPINESGVRSAIRVVLPQDGSLDETCESARNDAGHAGYPRLSGHSWNLVGLYVNLTASAREM